MPTHTDRLLHCVRRLASQVGREPDDAELLGRFLASRDPAAFEALVARHGPMVLRVCQRVLGNRHDAEDAFQATFLVLARKAASVRPAGALAAWLHGVAYRVAAGARAVARRRRRQEHTPDLDPPDPRPDPLAELTAREALRLLEEEVQRLPEAYRLPVVLCCLHGLTQEEVARQLGWTPGAVKGCLERGRQRLQRRLAGRGLGLGAALALVEVSRATAAGPGAALTVATALAAVTVASGSTARACLVSVKVKALFEGGLRHMVVARVKFGLLLLLAAASAAGLAALGQLPAEKPPEARAGEPDHSGQKTEPPRAPNQEEQARTDRYGDPLPEGAVVRFGSAHLRHGGSVGASALSPDGKTLATAGHHSVVVWDLAKGRPLRRFPCAQNGRFAIPGLTFSSDGTRLGYVRSDTFACVWDLRTGQELRRFERRREDGLAKVWSGHCRFVKDGQEFVLVSRGAIETWDLRSGKQVASVPVKDCVNLSPDGKTYFRIGGPAELCLCDTGTGDELARWDVAFRGSEGGLACSADGKSVAVVHDQKEVQVRATADGKVLASFPLPGSAQYSNAGQKYWEYRVTFSADGKTLLLGTYGGLIHRWDLASARELPPLSKHYCTVTGVHTLPDGRTLVSTGEDGVIRRWDLTTGRQEAAPESYEGQSKGAYSPDGRFVAVGDARGRIDLWDGRDGKLIRTFQQDGAAVTHLAFAPEGNLLATAQRSGTVKFWHVPSGQPGEVWQHEPVRGEWFCYGIHFSPDGRRLCVNDYPRQIRVVEVAGGKVHWTGPDSFGEAFSPDGTTLLVALTGPYIATLDAATGKKMTRIKLDVDIGDGLGVWYTLAFSPDGRQMAVALDFGALLLCDGRTGTETHRLAQGESPARVMQRELLGKRLPNNVRALAFSPDGKWLASAGSDMAVYVWEAATGKEVLRLPGHEAEVSSVAFSPDGQKVFSFGADGQGYLWSLKARPPAGRRSVLEELWTDLGGADASKAHAAVRALTEDPGAGEFMRKHLVPVVPPDGVRVAKLIADLDDDRFDVREAARRELERLEELAEAPLRKALAGKPSPEVRRRAEALLGALSAGATPTALRTLRATAVLEYMATPEARQQLAALAKGAPEARLTQEAKAALERLARRQALNP